MKLKIRFPGSLLPFRKQINYKNIADKALDDRRMNRYAIGLLLLWLLIVLLSSCTAYAQDGPGIKVGETAPAISVGHIINYPKKTVTLRSFKGKLLILDFWATWCTPCVEMMPKIDSLQQAFAGRIQFLPVTFQSEKLVRAFLKAREKSGAPHSQLPDVVGDKRLSALFYHRFVPHYVWIGGDGKVLAITAAEAVTRENIQNMLGGKNSTGAQKMDIDDTLPLFSGPFLPMDNLSNYAVFFRGNVQGTGSGVHPRKTAKLIGLAFTNTHLLAMYAACGSGLIKGFENKQLVLQVKDSSGLVIPARKADRMRWYPDNLYSLDLIMPLRDSSLLFAKVLSALNEYSDYRVTMEKRLVPCLSLTLLKDTADIKSHFSDNYDMLGDSTLRLARHIPVRNLVAWLNWQQPTWPLVIDKTGDKGFIDLDLGSGAETSEALKATLRRQGFLLTETTQEITQLVIRDKEHPIAKNLNPE